MAYVVYTDRLGNVTRERPVIDKDAYVLGLDGSTSRSGVCVMSVGGRLGFVCAVVREKETMVEYKVFLKKFLTDLIQEYEIKHTAYEEPFIGFVQDAKSLYMLASSLSEIAVETGMSFSVTPVNNMRWKKRFLARKLEGGSQVHKKAVREKVIALIPALAVLAKNKDDYDESDAFGLTFYLAQCVRDNVMESMQSVGKPRKFKYDLQLVGGAVTAEEALKLVNKPRKDGVVIENISTKKNFDLTVYTLMQGKDAILVLYFKSGKFGDVILKHDAGEIAAKHDTITAIVTRKSKSRAKSRTV